MQIKFSGDITEPILLADVKTYCRIDFDNEDTLITNLIKGVREAIEEFTGLALVVKTIELFNEDIEEITLPYPEHDSITEVKFNNEVSTAYKTTGLTQKIIKPDGVTFASNVDDWGMYVKYTTTGNCPQAIKNEMYRLIDEKYRNRGNTFEGSIATLDENCYSNLARFCV